MSKYVVTPFAPEHYVAIYEHAYVWGAQMPPIDPVKTAQQFFAGGPAFSGFYDGAILGCVGLIIPWPGLGHAWAVLTPLALQHALWLHRHVKTGLDNLIATSRLRRVEASVDASFERGQRWARHLRFAKECEMPGYGPKGETFTKYVRLCGVRP